MTSFQTALPEFELPPVSEVAISVEFAPLPGWRSPHAGLYWSSITAEYPKTDVKPPLSSQREKFGEDVWQPPQVNIQLGDPDFNRFWFLTEPPNRLIQVQRDRFIVNWRKVTGEETYPRFESDIRPRFVREWGRFRDFVGKQKLGDPKARQCELTYIDDMPKGEGWETFSESLAMFSPWWGKGTDGFLPLPEALNVAGAFRLPDDKGRLHFLVQHVRRGIDAKEVVQLRLTARGEPESSRDEDVLAWMDMAHEWVVRGFADLTSSKAHDLWKRLR